MTDAPGLAAAVLPTNQDLDPTRLREAFGVFPSGVVAVAAVVDGAPVGLAASSFTSVSLDPPLVSFSIANTSKTWHLLRRADHLGVTVLASHHDRTCRQLAGPVEERFSGLTTEVGEEGAVTLPDGLAAFDCTIHDELVAGDHTIVVLGLHRVHHAREVSGEAVGEPLVFHRSAFTGIAVGVAS